MAARFLYRFAAGIALTTGLIALTSMMPAHAQGETPPAEAIEIGLSTDTVAITADFSGAELTIFGALDNADPQVLRQGHYDIIVVLEGPGLKTVVRKKERVFGLWVNTQSEQFDNVPVSYSMATTRARQDITGEKSYEQLSLGPENIYLAPAEGETAGPAAEHFADALKAIKKAKGTYNERVGGVTFLSQSLFRATLDLPPNVSIGTHRARAYLFKNGAFIGETSAPLIIVKSGLEAAIYRFAHEHGFLFGIIAVILAVVSGWLGRVLFKRD